MPPEIIDGKITLDVTLLHPPDGGTEAPEHDVFLRWWSGEARRRSAVRPRWTGEDRKIAIRLLGQHGYAGLQRLALHFWRRHAREIVSSEYHRHMIAFAAKIPIIERELSEQAP